MDAAPTIGAGDSGTGAGPIIVWRERSGHTRTLMDRLWKPDILPSGGLSMHQQSDLAASARARVELARTEAFRLGNIDVRPPTLELKRGGQSQTLEPRIMQVLVALWRAGGAVVTRDDLVASCWDGRIVGDNAIQRPISRLRELAAGFCSGCFRLETVNKVGYRLVQIDGDGEKPAATSWRQHRGALIGGAAILALGLAGALFFAIRAPASGSVTVALVADTGAAAARMANGLAVDLSRLSAGRRNSVVFENGSGRAGADYVLRIAEQTVGGRMQVDLSLFKAGLQNPVWSGAFARPPGEVASLRQQIAYKLDHLENCALRTGGGSGDAGRLRNVFSACDRSDDAPDPAALKLWRRVVDDDRNNASALAELAFLEARLALPAIDETPETRSRRLAAGDRNEKARSMNRGPGTIYATASLLLPSWRYREIAAVLNRGLALDPDCAALHDAKATALQNVGRMEDAIASERAAVELDPGSAWHRANLISALAYTGYLEEAAKELRKAGQVWPDSLALREMRGRFDLRFGNPVPLIRAVDRGNSWQNFSIAELQGMTRAFLVARAQPTVTNIESAVRQATTNGPPYFYLQTLVAFGRIDEAFRVAATARNVASLRSDGTYILFRTNMEALRRDRRFMALSDRIGLIQYWQSTNAWPDFCDDKSLKYDCRIEALRLRPHPA